MDSPTLDVTKKTLRGGVNLNYRFRAVTKGLLRTIFFDKLF